MSLSCQELVDDIQAYTGRVGDTALVDDTRCTRWINDAQRYIVDKCPGIKELEFKNTASLDITTDGISYSINDLTFSTPADTTTEKAAHIQDVWHIDGANSIRLDFQPLDEFDNALIDPTSSEHSAGRPTRWTQRGNYIEIAPRPSSDYDSDALRVDGTRYMVDFTTDSTITCEVDGIDEGLRLYGTAQAYKAMGSAEAMAKYNVTWKSFTNPNPLPGESYGWLEQYIDLQNLTPAWDNDVIFDSELD